MFVDCGNGLLTGTATGAAVIDQPTAGGAALITQRWCTQYSTPSGVDETFTQQHFAKLWYELLIDSPSFLGIVQGQSDPYVWTTGQGCGYTLRGQRYSYTNQSESEVLHNSSRLLYYLDEGTSVGPIDRNLIIGGATPRVGDYDFSNPLKSVSVVQNLYIFNHAKEMPDRVRNCNRPGGPISITLADAEEVLFRFKEAFEESWGTLWDDPLAGDMQFVAFSDGTYKKVYLIALQYEFSY